MHQEAIGQGQLIQRMIKNALHKIASYPLIYDFIQRSVGAQFVYNRISAQLSDTDENGLIIDIGGGTGISLSLLQRNLKGYLCIDIDPVKISGFRRKYPQKNCLLGDASQLPISSRIVDVVLCASVAHHLSIDILEQSLKEIVRVLKPGGKLIFLDPVWAPYNLPGRLIWALDRGSFPRRDKDLRNLLANYGNVSYQESIAIFHRYCLCVVTPQD